ncbi:MAG: ATP-binding protein [Steroidobacteraceae bacterium]
MVRHARAHVVEIGLETTDAEAVLTVHDDGVGIASVAADNRESLGILGMRERAMLVNGRVSLTGGPGQGTTVRVSVPLPACAKVTNAHPAG